MKEERTKKKKEGKNEGRQKTATRYFRDILTTQNRNNTPKIPISITFPFSSHE